MDYWSRKLKNWFSNNSSPPSASLTAPPTMNPSRSPSKDLKKRYSKELVPSVAIQLLLGRRIEAFDESAFFSSFTPNIVPEPTKGSDSANNAILTMSGTTLAGKKMKENSLDETDSSSSSPLSKSTNNVNAPQILPTEWMRQALVAETRRLLWFSCTCVLAELWCSFLSSLSSPPNHLFNHHSFT